MGTISTGQSARLQLWAAASVPWRTRHWPGQALRVALGWMQATLERARQRQALARLDDRQLQDLGLPPEHVTAELRKWFWQV